VERNQQLQALSNQLASEIQRVCPPDRLQQLDEARVFDHELHAALSKMGVWGLGVSKEAGGQGGSLMDQLHVLHACGQHATFMGMFCVVHYLCSRILNQNASDSQRAAYLEPLSQGAIKASFCLTEAGGGTDILRAMQTRAESAGTDYVLNGSKAWISGASFADFFIVVARTAPGKTDGVSMFIVPRETPGITIRRMPTFAINPYEACEVDFHDVRIPQDHLLGTAGQGFRQLIEMLNAERLCASGNALGIAKGALKIAADYVVQRRAFNKTLSDMQAVQHKLADVATTYELAWTYLMETARKHERDESIDVASSMAKVASVEAAKLATDVGMEVMGANGFLLSNPMQRYYRDYRLYVIAPLNNQMSRSLIAERYFGFKRAS
jgi:acyl-CoA dehydrogenase